MVKLGRMTCEEYKNTEAVRRHNVLERQKTVSKMIHNPLVPL